MSPPAGRRGEEGARVRTGSEAWNSPSLPPCAQTAAAREGRRGGDEVKETVAAALDEREGAARRSEEKERERCGGRRVSRAVTRMRGQSGAAGAESGSGEKQQRWRWKATEGARGRRSRWAWFAHRE